jgi:outer membrane protein assembly factor BamB
MGHLNFIRLRSFTALALALAWPDLADTATAADWPMFRGNPALTGVAEGRLAAPLKLLWSTKTGGPVKSSAAIVGGKVFVGSDDGQVYALELGSGRELWKFKTGEAVESSPLVLAGRVYVGNGNGTVYCLDAASGNELWKHQTGAKVVAGPTWVKAPQGGVNWILVGSHDYFLHCLDAQTGKTNWLYETGNFINGTPAVADGQAVFGGCDALLHVVALADGRLALTNDVGAPVAASAALAGGRAYLGHYENEFVSLELKSGRRMWTFKDRPFAFMSSPAVTADRVLFGGRDKRLHCVQRADGKPVWRFTTQARVDSSPVVVGDKVVVGSEDGRLYVVSLADGKEQWSYEIGGALSASPAVADGRVVIGSEDGGIYCFGPP